ncbi:phosphotransferase [Paenibacillus chartarius]|uniref:Phosphotransferase n=1 Tax=Paenibacillus chartarius TaxID=747481 RepID=A0ABV6DVK0_9BACL
MAAPDIELIVQDLRSRGIIENTSQVSGHMSGTTQGRVFTITVHEQPTYIVKIDSPSSTAYDVQFLAAYENSPLIPKLIYVGEGHSFFVYGYLAGTTHVQRGSKADWMKRLVRDLLNHYVPDRCTEGWGRLEAPASTWQQFHERSLEEARADIGDLLSYADYERVKSLLPVISVGHHKCLLHGDTGVHNFVFREHRLVGVIDPCPMAGPLLYDFTYAFCSSPDDLNEETLFAVYDLLRHAPFERARLRDEVLFQLYCRIGICVRHHPHDLPGYLQAWKSWAG